MPWSRQGNHAEGPWRRRRALDLDGPTWPNMEPFGSQVLPRDLSLFPDGSLKMVPVPELASLRKQPDSNSTHYHAAIPSDTVACLPVRGRQLEVKFTVHVASANGAGAAASVSVLASPTVASRR